MSINAAADWEVRTTGNDANGGGFNRGASGTDYSQQNAAQATLTAAATVHTTTTQINVPGGEYTVSANDIGNIFQLAGGTATAGFYEITAVDVPNNRWTVDRVVGTAGQTTPGRMGGALASPAMAAGPIQNGNIVYIKSGTYLMSVNTINVANGKWSKNAGVVVIGYNTNRVWGNTDTRPLIQATVALTTMWDGQSNWVYNVDFDANSQAATKCVNLGAYTRCSFSNATAANSGIALATHCTATGNSGSPFTGSNFAYCEAYANTAAGFTITNGNLFGCAAYGNTGATTDGFVVGSIASGHFFNCIAYNNGRDGFRNTSTTTSRMLLENCAAENNAGYAVNNVNGLYYSLLVRCAFYNNTLGATNGLINTVATITPTGSVFTNAAAADFSLNNTANRGALLRGTGYIDISGNTFPRALTTSYLDVGLAQHQDTGGGGGATSAAYLG